jgi:hypothetical protein
VDGPGALIVSGNVDTHTPAFPPFSPSRSKPPNIIQKNKKIILGLEVEGKLDNKGKICVPGAHYLSPKQANG